MAGESASEAIAAYQRDQRAAQLDNSRVKARRGVTRALYKMYGPDLSRAPYPCHRVCVECGHTFDPTPQGDPMRRRIDPTSADQSRCRACGLQSAIDVSLDSTAIKLCESDREVERLSTPPSLMVATTVLITAAIMGIGLLEGWKPEHFYMLALIGGPILGTVGLSIHRRLVPRRSRPRRWHFNAIPKGKVDHRYDGAVFARQRLFAPISGRECVAYEVAIAPAGQRPSDDGQWLVREQKSASLVVGDHTAAGQDVALALDPDARPQCSDPNPDALARFLRERGLMTHADVDVYETVVEKGQTVTLRRHRGSRVQTLTPALSA